MRKVWIVAVGVMAAIVVVGLIAVRPAQGAQRGHAAISHVRRSGTASPGVAQGPSCAGTGWSLVPSPNVGTQANNLLAVAAVGPRDVWAVGDWQNTGAAVQPLAEHWNGAQWNVVATPEPAAGNGKLNALAAVSSSDVWAVGYYYPTLLTQATLIEHWDGSAWSVMPSPNVSGEHQNVLQGVAAISATDVWAVGWLGNAGQVLTEHWDGQSWSIVPGANEAGTSVALYAVSAVTTADVWATGEGYDTTTSSWTPLIEHWDGVNWSIAAIADTSLTGVLTSVSAESSGDVWAAGASEGTAGLPALLHWNGATWNAVATSAGSMTLTEVAIMPGSSGVWVSGALFVNNQAYLISERLTAQGWIRISMPSAAIGTAIDGVAALSSGSAWAVGSGSGVTVTERYVAPMLGLLCSR